MMRRMSWADENARASELSAHLEWPHAEDGDMEAPDEEAPTVRGFFLGQLPERPVDATWTDEPRDEGLEGIELDGWPADVQGSSTLPLGEEEQPLVSGSDEPTRAAIPKAIVLPAEPPAGDGMQVPRMARKRRAQRRRSRIVMVGAAVVALVAGTGVYVGTNAKAGDGDQRARRPTPTSFERHSSSTTATTLAAPEVTPDTEPAPAPASDAAPGSAAPTSRPGAPRATSSPQTGAPGTSGSAATAPPPPAPGSTGPPPSSAAPPSNPPPSSPMCQVLPIVCP
jgi:hypothetical protein